MATKSYKELQEKYTYEEIQFFGVNCDDVIGKKGLLNRLKNVSEIKMKFYYINLSQLLTFTKYICSNIDF